VVVQYCDYTALDWYPYNTATACLVFSLSLWLLHNTHQDRVSVFIVTAELVTVCMYVRHSHTGTVVLPPEFTLSTLETI